MKPDSESDPLDASLRVNRREFLKTSALATVAGAASSLPLAAAREKVSSEPIPPHDALSVEGVHLYTGATSYRSGETLRLHASASVPHRIDIVRHDRASIDPAGDPVIASQRVEKPVMQPVHAGSYIHVARGLTEKEASTLTLECWVRPWNIHEPQGVITQLDGARGFGLIAFPDGTLGFFTGDSDDPAETKHRTEKALTLPDKGAGIPYVVPPAPWHHVVATAGGGKRAVWIDGRKAGEWKRQDSLEFADAPLRIGALGRDGEAAGFLDADIAMPVIYGRALDYVEIQTRLAERGLAAPDPGSGALACWPLDEELGDRVRDLGPGEREGRIVNHATWMIGGPSFLPAVPRYKKDYDPGKDPTRGHGLRFASDDLYDCRWDISHEFTLPRDAAPGLYSARATFEQDGEEVTTHALFVLRRARGAPRSPVAFLVATNTFKAYSGSPFCPGWKGATFVGGKGYKPDPKDPAAGYCFYRFHRAGQPAYQLGWRMPWPVASPYAVYAPVENGYAHLSASNLWTWSWLNDNGYDCDTLSDYDLQADPEALDGVKVLYIAGHNEYWSLPMMERLRRFLDRGGKVVHLSGNTMYWRVSFSDDGGVIECRKADAWGAQLAGYMRGECWHSHDKLRGGVPRDSGHPAWKLVGVEFAAAYGQIRDGTGKGAFHVVDAAHPFLTTPNATGLEKGDRFAFDPGNPGRHPIGHETDVLVSNMMKMARRAGLPRGVTADLEDPEGITLIAEGRLDSGAVPGAYRDYFTHAVVKPQHRQPDDSLCDVIHWRRPGGGEVFAAPSIAAGWTLGHCPQWTAMMKNVLHHFGV